MTVIVWFSDAGCSSILTSQAPLLSALVFQELPPSSNSTLTASLASAYSPHMVARAGARCRTMFESMKVGSSGRAAHCTAPVHVRLMRTAW